MSKHIKHLSPRQWAGLSWPSTRTLRLLCCYFINIYMWNFKAIGAIPFELSCDKNESTCTLNNYIFGKREVKPIFCYLNILLSKALVPRQNVKLHINIFSGIYKNVCVRVWVYVCYLFFCRMITRKGLHQSLQNLAQTF